MINYNCVICNKIFNNKQKFTRHLQTEKHNKTLQNNKNESNTKLYSTTDINGHQRTQTDIKKNMKLKIKKGYKADNYNCEFCNLEIKNKKNLKIHLKLYCYDVSDDIKSMLINKHNKNKYTKNKIQNIINNNTINNNINNNQTINNITINTNNANDTKNLIEIFCLMFETIDHLTDDDKIKLLKAPNHIIPNLIDKIYENPSNHNVYIKDKRLNTMTYIDHDTKTIKTSTKDTVLPQIYTQYMYHLDCIFDEYKNQLSTLICNKVKTIIELYEKDDNKFMNRLKNELFCKITQISNQSKEKINNLFKKTINNNTKFYYNYNNNDNNSDNNSDNNNNIIPIIELN